MAQKDLRKMVFKPSILFTAFLSCCYSSGNPPSGQPETTNLTAKDNVEGHIVGKMRTATGKNWGKRIGMGPAHKDASLPVSVSVGAPGKQRIPKEVQDGILAEAASSSLPVRVTVDAQLGTLRTISGKWENPFGNSTEGAVQYLDEHITQLGLSSSEPLNLVVEREIIDEDGSIHVVVAPRVGELPVWQTTAAIHLDVLGNVRSINAQKLAPLEVDSTIRFDEDAAVASATKSALPLSIDEAVSTVTEPVLGIFPAAKKDASASYAWKFIQFLMDEQEIPQYYETYVDVEDGAVLARYPMTIVESLTPATGSGTNMQGETENLRISYLESAGTYVLLDQSRGTASGEIFTYNANNEYSITLSNSTLLSSSSADSWDVIGASTHANFQKTIDYWLDTHGRNSWDGQGAAVRAIVHYGQEYNNAYWSSYDRQMVFGNGDGSMYVAFGTALDVVAHEFGHAVVSATAGLKYQNQSGALNEAFADVTSVMVDRDNWTQGEHAIGPYNSSDAIRSLADPPLYGNPGHMDDYQDISWDHGGVHINCGIPSHAAYLVGNRETVEKVWYRTLNQGHVSTLANFNDMAEGTLVACDELVEKGELVQSDCDAVADGWVEVGVLTEVSASGCPANATEKDGLCYCDDGFAPALYGNECVAEGELDCPEHSIETNGQCFCEDGYRVPPSDDETAPMTCEPEENACPKNSAWDASVSQCVCNEGFEGNPDGMDGGCTVISSDCPKNSHPEWNSDKETNPDDYGCLCNDGFEYDAGECVVEPGGCGNETFYGRCDGGNLIYCGPEGIETVGCEEESLVCGLLDSRIGYDCLNPDGVGAAETCEADGYQECDADNPFCVYEADDEEGFCSKECKVNEDCGADYTCCGTVDDGTRACLTEAYCDDVVDAKAVCTDVVGGSAYYGSCDGNVLRYCDGSTATTQQVNCPKLGLACRFVDEEVGYNCVEDDSSAAMVAPADWCPYENDGVCDVPDLCPEGSDLLDCNPCGEVTEAGSCDDTLLTRCDSELGLVETDCATLDETPECGVDEDGNAACVAAASEDTETGFAEEDTDTVTDEEGDTDTVTDEEGDTDTVTDEEGDTDTVTDDDDTESDSSDTDSDTDTEQAEEEEKSVSCSCNSVGSPTAVSLFSLLDVLL